VITGRDHKFDYNGMEFQDELGLDWYDLGARNHDPALGRFMNLDPLAEDYVHQSTYAFAANNPIYYIDFNGEGVENDYGVDQDGNIILLKETDDETDTLYALNCYADNDDYDINESAGSVTVNQNEDGSSVLSDLADKKFNTDGYNELSVAKTSSFDDAFNVFLFAADNSSVEWSLDGFNVDGENSFVLGTQHEERVAINTHYLFSGLSLENKTFDLHSHPETKGGSGYELEGYMYGDKLRQYRQYTRHGASSSLLYYIYHRDSKNLYQYTPQKADHLIKNIKSSKDIPF